ncbi:MAG: hypothetical protein O2798_00700 [Chloroflexi bacterium]|nr:hypothetical protein [Chloroflexota bacterium]MDA1239341.1 hypothetical protein [Chloroflexota bacterium]
MKRIRIYTGDDGESHFEEHPIAFGDGDRPAAEVEAAESIQFRIRKGGTALDYHPAPRRQYVVYLTARVQIGCWDGSKVIMEPGDVLQAEDATGRGHTSTILQEGVCAFVPLG